MSPFSQLATHLPSSLGYGGGIDRDFSPILNYLDEFDRHFSRRHHFLNCFIPRFDLEEDAQNYYLEGDLPGVRVEDISVEAHDRHTLVIEGRVPKLGSSVGQEREHGYDEGREEGNKIGVNVEDGNREKRDQEQQQQQGGYGGGKTSVGETVKREEGRDVDTIQPSSSSTAPPPPPKESFPPPPANPITQGHPHHQRRESTYSRAGEKTDGSGRRILLSERLTGDFHRTFAFPQEIVEEGVRACVLDGVLSLVVPKRKGTLEKRGRRVEVRRGGWGTNEGARDEGKGERRDESEGDKRQHEYERREVDRRGST